MAKPKPIPAAPGGSDMSMREAFQRVLRLASHAYDNDDIDIDTERDAKAIDLIQALGVGSFSLRPEAR